MTRARTGRSYSEWPCYDAVPHRNSETGGSDLLVAGVDTLSLTGGAQTVAFASGDANVQVPAGNNKTYWISVLVRAGTSSQTPTASV